MSYNILNINSGGKRMNIKKSAMGLVLGSTLLVAGCAGGETSSSASSSANSSTNSSVSSSASSSTYAAVSQITIAAPTNQLTQTVGSLSRVAFTASTNAGANPSVVEWFVNDVKSTVKGLNFEFAPTAAGTYVVQSKVGTVVSNSLTLTVGGASSSFVIESVTAIDSDTFEVKALGGAAVSVTGKVLASTSRYDLARGVYVVDVTTAFAQGATATVTLVRDGVTKTEVFTFDTRKLEVASLKDASNNEITILPGGVYEITKPHITESTVNNYSAAFKSTNILGAEVLYKLEAVSLPTGTDAYSTLQGQLNMTSLDSDSDGIVSSISNTLTFSVNKDTPVGLRRYKFTLGGVEREILVRISEPTPTVKVLEKTIDDNTTVAIEKFDLVSKSFTGSVNANDKANLVTSFGASGTAWENSTGINKNTNGSYTVLKPYLSTDFVAFGFDLSAEFFGIPSFALNNSQNVNILSVSVLGPNSVTAVSTQTAGLQNFLTPENFRAGVSYPVVQYLDSTTPVGVYTYTVTVKDAQTNSNLFTRNVVVNIEAPQAKLSLTGSVLTANELKVLNDTGVFTIEKPNALSSNTVTLTFGLKLDNYQSPINFAGVLSNSFETSVGSKELLTFSKVYNGPMTLTSGAGSDQSFLGTEKIAIELGASQALVANRFSVPGTQADSGNLIKDRRSVDFEYHDYYHVNANNITTLPGVQLTLDKNSVSGEYRFTVNIGAVSKQITINVVNPKADVVLNPNAISFVEHASQTAAGFYSGTLDTPPTTVAHPSFYLDTDTGNGTLFVSTGVSNNVTQWSATTITNFSVSDFALNSKDGKYYATLPAKAGGSTPTVNALFNLLLKNITPTGNLVNYSLTITDSKGVSSSVSSNIAVSVPNAQGNLYSDGILGSVGTVVSTGANAFTNVNFTEVGEYVYTLTVNGTVETVRLVVLPYPTLKVETAKIGTSDLVSLGNNTDYIVDHSKVKTGFTGVFGLSADNLPEGTLYFTVTAFGTTTSRTKLEFTNGIRQLSLTATDANIADDSETLNTLNTTIVIKIYNAESAGSQIGEKSIVLWIVNVPTA
jgi:hypothetical protein